MKRVVRRRPQAAPATTISQYEQYIRLINAGLTLAHILLKFFN